MVRQLEGICWNWRWLQFNWARTKVSFCESLPGECWKQHPASAQRWCVQGNELCPFSGLPEEDSVFFCELPQEAVWFEY